MLGDICSKANDVYISFLSITTTTESLVGLRIEFCLTVKQISRKRCCGVIAPKHMGGWWLLRLT